MNESINKSAIAAVSNNTRPALSKTFQDFGFFCDVNHSYRSIHCLSNKGGNIGAEAANVNVGRNVPIRFHSPIGFGSSLGKISPWKSKLAMLKYRKKL